ncbi:MAG: glycosyltransferase family 39 protein [Gemmatimonadales bacterium]|nr:glycosyltransferase family 39 protein [Gemmatimonadales bacterium]
MLLHAWLRLFRSDAAARWLTVALGCVSVLPVWGLARRLGGHRVGVATAVLIAASPMHVWHSQNGRGYILYFLLAALTCSSFYRALETNDNRHWLTYAICGVLGMYAHYYFVFLLLTQGLTLILEPVFKARLKGATLALGTLVVGVLPLAWVALPDFTSEAVTPFAVPFQPAAIPYSYFALLTGYSLGPSAAELHTMKPADMAAGLAGWLVALGVSVTILAVNGAKELGWTWMRRLGLLVLVPVLLCVPLAGALSITYQVRHLIWVLIPLVVLLGAGAARGRGRWPVAAAALCLLLLFAISLHHRRYVPRYANEDLRALASYLKTKGSTASPIFVMTGYMAKPLSYYLGPRRRIYQLPRVERNDASLRQSLAYMRDRVPAGSSFWLVYVRSFHGDPEGRFLESVLREHRSGRRIDFPGVVLREVRL